MARKLYTLWAENDYYNLELLNTKDIDEAMKAGAMFGRIKDNLVVWNDHYSEPQPEKMERIVLCEYAHLGEKTLGFFDEQGDFIEVED